MVSCKKQLRTQARKHRAIIDHTPEDTQSACDLFFEHIKPTQNQIIAAYWPTGSEFDPTPIFERALNQNILCALPVIRENTRILDFAPWSADTKMRKNKHGILEPISTETCTPDIIITPLLAFDTKGMRLGQGGGYYDATFANLRATKEITAIGIAFATQAVLFKLPSEEHDQPLDWVITPQSAHDFR